MKINFSEQSNTKILEDKKNNNIKIDITALTDYSTLRLYTHNNVFTDIFNNKNIISGAFVYKPNTCTH